MRVEGSGFRVCNLLVHLELRVRNLGVPELVPHHLEEGRRGNLLVRIHFIIVMIRWTSLAPWDFEFPFPGSLTSTFQTAADQIFETRVFNPKP